jgi:hypothetical protein
MNSILIQQKWKGVAMRQVLANDKVSLLQDIPELELYRGDVGVVVSSWFWPNTAYEVEFDGKTTCRKRVLLLEQQIEEN